MKDIYAAFIYEIHTETIADVGDFSTWDEARREAIDFAQQNFGLWGVCIMLFQPKDSSFTRIETIGIGQEDVSKLDANLRTTYYPEYLLKKQREEVEEESKVLTIDCSSRFKIMDMEE